jgi:hypothetical protein
MRAAIRNYWIDGRMLVLLRHVTLSYGIAAIEWALNPEFLFTRFIVLRHAP